uniref:Putative structural protein n=1 Tax=viral metagenome TaxID=1070528 RepID=A0A6M3KFR5_9ZZZZ
MWTRARFNARYVPGLFTAAIDSYITKRQESMWPYLVTKKASVKKKEEDTLRSGLGLAQIKGEGSPITYDTQIEGAKQSWIHRVEALAVRITEEAIDDCLYELGNPGGGDDMKEIFHDLGEALAESKEVYMARLFNNATATTYHTTRDGVAFASASHARLDGSTYSNYSTNADLTYLAFWAVLVAAENQFNHQQYRIRKKVKNLWYPPQLERQASEVLYSPDRPDSTNRAISAYARSNRKIMPRNWPHMTDEDMWVLHMEGRGVVYFDRRKTRFAREQDFQTGDMMAKGDQRYSAEIADERDFYFNIPA